MAVSKERKKKRRRKNHILLKILIFVGCAVGLYFFMVSDYFCIAHVDVDGMEHYTKEDILGICGDPRGQNVFEVDLSGMQKLLSEDAYIESAVVERKLVAGVHIRIKERTPFVAVMQEKEGNAFWAILDADEHWIDSVPAEPEIPAISGVSLSEGEGHLATLREKQSLFHQTLQLVHKTSEAGLYFKKIDIQDAVITLYIYDQLICSGTPENISNGLDTLKEVLIDLTNKGIKEGEIRISGEATASFTPQQKPEEPIPEPKE